MTRTERRRIVVNNPQVIIPTDQLPNFTAQKKKTETKRLQN
jgi:hypothetical protein